MKRLSLALAALLFAAASAGARGRVSTHSRGTAARGFARRVAPRAGFRARVFSSRSASAARRGVARNSGGTAQTPPPNFSKPGALIRTEGQLPVYSDPGNARTHSVDGGGFIGPPPSGAPAAVAGGNGATVNTPARGPVFDPSF
jgi:hypothetical protein